MSGEKETTKTSFISKIPTTWASLLAIIAAIGTVINFYWKADSYIHEKVNSEVKKEIAAYHKSVEKERDSIISNINHEFFEPLEKEVNLNTYFINNEAQAIHAEFEPYDYKGVRVYTTDPNSSGYRQYWYIFERNKRWEIHKCTYNATHDKFEFYDFVERKRKFIKP